MQDRSGRYRADAAPQPGLPNLVATSVLRQVQRVLAKAEATKLSRHKSPMCRLAKALAQDSRIASYSGLAVRFMLVVATCTCLGLSSCGEPQLTPIGEPNKSVITLAANNWLSADTIIRIDPLTGAEQIESYTSDMRPDTLANGRIIYQVVEHMPIFAGCETDPDPSICTQRKLAEYVRDHVDYPVRAQAAGLQGNAVATFVIGPDGRVGETGVERSLGDLLDGEVLRLVSSMPPWHPGFHDGKPVAVYYRLPVDFTLPQD